jgi:hypothetical protein
MYTTSHAMPEPISARTVCQMAHHKNIIITLITPHLILWNRTLHFYSQI